MDYLCELTSDAARRKALKSLPPTLNATYERILRRVNSCSRDVQELVQRSLKWIVHSQTPISTAALCQAVSINRGDTALDYHAVPDESEILRRCGSLLRKSASGSALELAHFTVKEFLAGINNECPGEFAAYRGDQSRDIPRLTEICLLRLCSHEFTKCGIISKEELVYRQEEQPFRTYAISQWPVLAKYCMSDPIVYNLVQMILHPSRPNVFLSWAQEYSYLHRGKFLELTDINNDLATASPLHYAAFLQLSETCRWLLEMKCEVNQDSAFGTPLHCGLLGNDCIRAKRETEYWPYDFQPFSEARNATINVLLKAGADANTPIQSQDLRFSPLGLALTFSAKSDICVALIQHGAKVDNEFSDDFEERFLYRRDVNDYACDVAFDIVATIGERGLSKDDYTRLLETALKSNKSRTTSLLAKSAQRSRLDYTDIPTDYHPSLRSAAQFGSLDVINELLQITPIDLNRPDEETGETALQLAASYGHLEIVKLLIEHGADSSLTDGLGLSALHRSIEVGNSIVFCYLMQQGSDMSSIDGQGFTVWHMAALYNNTQVLEILWNQSKRTEGRGCPLAMREENEDAALFQHGLGAVIELSGTHQQRNIYLQRSTDGSSPLHIAAKFGSLAAMKCLVGQGFDVNAVTKDGSSILHCAVSCCRIESIRGALEFLIKEGANLCQTRKDGAAPIHLLVETIDTVGGAAILEMLRDHKIAINQGDADGLTALHKLCQLKQIKRYFGYRRDSWGEIGSITLLKQGADIRAADLLGRTSLVTLLNSWEKELVQKEPEEITLRTCARMTRFILDHSSPEQAIMNMERSIIMTYLSICSYEDDLTLKLLEYEPDVDEKPLIQHSSYSITPMQAACRYGCGRSLFKKLLDRSKARSEVYKSKSDLLWWACVGTGPMCHGHVLDLLQEGFSPNSRSQNGSTPLMLAAEKGNAAVVEELIRWEGDASIVNRKGFNAVHCAAFSGQEKTFRMLSQLNLGLQNSRVMAGSGSSYWHGATALHIAATLIDGSLLEYILVNDLFSDINATSTNGLTALHMASESGHSHNVSQLLSKGAKTNISSKVSPLHIAAFHGREEALLTLLDHGSDIQARDSLGLTPELCARKNGQAKMALILENHAQEKGMFYGPTIASSFF